MGHHKVSSGWDRVKMWCGESRTGPSWGVVKVGQCKVSSGWDMVKVEQDESRTV